MADPAYKHVFIDNQFTEGAQFRKFFLESREFNDSTLHNLAPRGTKSLPREQRAKAIAERVEQGATTAAEVVLAFCEQPRDWLALWKVDGASAPKAAEPLDLISKSGDAEWHGPVMGPTAAWYVRTFYVRHRTPDPELPSKTRVYKIRWHLIAEVTTRYVAFHWNGFTYVGDDSKRTHDAQFEFWRHVPKAIAELEELVGGTWQRPDLFDIVFKQLMEKYLDTPDPKWVHLRVRAELEGVAVNAKSAAIRELNVEGLGALTKKMAETALIANGLPKSPDKVRVTSKALMKTLLQDWGTRSYGFSLKGEHFDFEGHCYFGQLTDPKFGQDVLQHVMCRENKGKSTEAIKFFLPYI